MTFDVDETILLYHTFVILKGLEKKQKPLTTDIDIDVEQQQNARKKELKSVDTPTLKAAPWNNKTKNTNTSTKVIDTSGDKKKRHIK